MTAVQLTKSLQIALIDIDAFPHGGYPSYWKPKAREKLQALGLVEERPGQYKPSYFLTEAGKATLEALR